VVAAVTLLAVVAATAISLGARPTYTGKSTLMLSGRTPDQDAVMVIGYLTVFNDPATIDRLTAATGSPEGVTIEARTAAASPILTIEATADDANVAQDTAEEIANAFAADINSTQQAGKDERLADLQRQLEAAAPLAPDGSPNSYFNALLTQIDEVRSSSTNELLSLQPRAGVTENAPHTLFNIGSSALGGVVLGLLAALGLGAASTRLKRLADVREKTGVEPLIEMPAGASSDDDVRRDRARALADIITLEDLSTPCVIALTDSGKGRSAREVAQLLSERFALRSSRTILLQADNDASAEAGYGFNDALADADMVAVLLKDDQAESLKVLSAGHYVDDRCSLLTRERIDAVMDRLRAQADVIIVAAPPIDDGIEAQLLCAAADTTILVVSKKLARSGDLRSAAEKLAKSHAVLLGAVLVDEKSVSRKRSGSRPGHVADDSPGLLSMDSGDQSPQHDDQQSHDGFLGRHPGLVEHGLPRADAQMDVRRAAQSLS
jgi:capsular polysaccharide biosynthesis protein